MIPVYFPDIDYKVNFPEKLGECSQREYVDMCRLIYLHQAGKITMDQFESLAVYSLLNVKRSSKPIKENDRQGIFENVAFLSQYVTNFFDIQEQEGKKQVTIKQDYIHNPIPTFNYRGIKFKGPADDFDDVLFGQYVDGLSYFLDYEKHKDFNTLVKLAETFYRPKYKLAAKLPGLGLNQLDVGILNGFYLYFASFQKYITSAVIEYSGVEIDFSIIFSGSDAPGNSKIPGLGMKSLLFSISESGVFGNAQEVRKTPLWEVLLRLYDIRKRALDMEAETKKNKSSKK